jgi:hypothetical protein
MRLGLPGGKLSVALLIISGWIGGTSDLAAQPACSTTFECAQRAVDAAARSEAAAQALQDRMNALEKELNTFDRFVTVQSPPQVHLTDAICPPNTRIVSASCVGNPGPTPQAAVGPVFDFNGTGKVTCYRYGTVEMQVQATAICLKTK